MHRVETAERLDRPLVEPAPLARPATHPSDIDLDEVHRHGSAQDPLGRRAPDARSEDDPLRIQTGGDEEAGYLGHEAELEVRVRREALRPAQEMPEAEVVERRHPRPRRCQHRADVVPVRPELGEPVGRHAGRRPRLAVRLERTDDEPAPVVADVQVAIEVAQEWEVLRRSGCLVGHDPDVLGGVQRDARVGETSQLGGPQAGRQDDDLCLDVAGGRRDARDATSVRSATEPRDRRPGHVPDAAIDRGPRKRERGSPRVDRAVVREEHAADEVVDHRRRPQGTDPLAVDDLRRKPGVPRDRHRPADLPEPLLGPGDRQRPDAAEPWVDAGLAAHPLVGLGIDPGQLRERVGAAHLRHEPGRMPGRPVRQTAALHEHDVGLAGLSEVVRDRRPDDPTADDHDPHG